MDVLAVTLRCLKSVWVLDYRMRGGAGGEGSISTSYFRKRYGVWSRGGSWLMNTLEVSVDQGVNEVDYLQVVGRRKPSFTCYSDDHVCQG